MAGYLSIILMIAGGVCLTSAETVGEFNTCQQKVVTNCTKSNPTFTSLTASQFSNFFISGKENQYCTKKGDFSRLLTCFLDGQRSCLEPDYQNILATGKAYNVGFDHYCNRVMNDSKNIDYRCIMNAPCTKDDVKINLNTTIAVYKEVLCCQWAIGAQCYEEHLKVCPETRKTVIEFMVLVKPEGCGGTSLFYNSILIFASLYLIKFFM